MQEFAEYRSRRFPNGMCSPLNTQLSELTKRSPIAVGLRSFTRPINNLSMH